MAFNQPIEETMSEVICHMLKRADKVNLIILVVNENMSNLFVD